MSQVLSQSGAETSSQGQQQANKEETVLPLQTAEILQQNLDQIPENFNTQVAPYLKDMQPQLQNVVATFNVGVRLDLKSIAMKARNAEYNPKRFAAVVMRIRKPKTTALIFENGKMVVTGAKDEDQSREAAKSFTKIINKLGYVDAKRRDFKIQNIVGSCDVRFPIRLEGLCFTHSNWTSYEPEMFPGLVFRMEQPKIVLLIFCSGKLVLTGAKHREQIYEAFNKIYPVLCDFKKEDAQHLIKQMNDQQLEQERQKKQQQKQDEIDQIQNEEQRIQNMKDVQEVDKVLEQLNEGFNNDGAGNAMSPMSPMNIPPPYTPAYTPAYMQEDYDDLE